MSPRERQNSPQNAAKGAPKGRAREKPSQSSQRDSEPRIRSVLIEPRHNEPPRVSVSVEYEQDAPTLAQLKKVAMEAVHDVMRREGKLEDLGYRHQQRSRELVQTFECREKESK